MWNFFVSWEKKKQKFHVGEVFFPPLCQTLFCTTHLGEVNHAFSGNQDLLPPSQERCLVVPCPACRVLLHAQCQCPPPVAAVYPPKCMWEGGHVPSVEVSTVQR